MSALSSPHRTRRPWLGASILAAGFVVLLWALEVVDSVADHRLDGLGVQPRDSDGLMGILFAPVLHYGWDHLGANTLPVLLLGFLVLVSGLARGLAATAIIWLVGGLGTWLVAPPHTVHLGASILIFGWLVYLVLRGFFARRAGEITLGVVLFLFYGSVLWGVLPGQPGISWQGHLFGALAGLLAARLSGRADRPVRPAPLPGPTLNG
jgi:membrane associated rhomboid family serine protease